MFDKKRCNKCSAIRSGILSPAIMFTSENMNHDECKLNCAKGNKSNIFITRTAILISVILLISLLLHFYKG